MIFQRINRTNAERIYVVMKANESGIAVDDVVQLDLTAGSADGVNIVQPETQGLNCVVGIADAAIADGAYGLVQVYGYRATSRIMSRSSSLVAGHILQPVDQVDELELVDAVPGSRTVLNETFVTLETKAAQTSSTFSAKIFIRAL